MSPNQELALVLGRVEANRGGIVLFHDTKLATAAMLPVFLRALKDRGTMLRRAGCLKFEGLFYT